MVELFLYGVVGLFAIGLFIWICYLIGNYKSKGAQSIEDDVYDGMILFISIAIFLLIVLVVGMMMKAVLPF